MRLGIIKGYAVQTAKDRGNLAGVLDCGRWQGIIFEHVGRLEV